MPAVLAVALLVVPLVELYVVVQVGQAIGVGWTVLVLLAVSLSGAVVLRREGARTWRAFRDALGRGRLPAAEVADGGLVLLGGALLLTPGFVTDAVGLLCVLPPTRVVLRRALTAAVARRLLPGVALHRPGRGGASGRGVVEGEVVDGGPHGAGPDGPGSRGPGSRGPGSRGPDSRGPGPDGSARG